MKILQMFLKCRCSKCTPAPSLHSVRCLGPSFSDPASGGRRRGGRGGEEGAIFEILGMFSRCSLWGFSRGEKGRGRSVREGSKGKEERRVVLRGGEGSPERELRGEGPEGCPVKRRDREGRGEG